MKKLFTLLLAFMAATTLLAHDFEVNGIYYNILDDKTNEVEVTWRGALSTSYEEYIGYIAIPESVTYEGTTYRVTEVGVGAFQGCTNLTSVMLPNHVTSIGDNAFWGCSGLEFVTIPDSLSWIGERGFYECTNLTTIILPNTMKSIPECVFANCTSLNHVTIPNSITFIGDGAFAYTGVSCVVLPASVRTLGFYVFSSCPNLREVTCESVKLPNLSQWVFFKTATDEATLYVPEESLEEYKTAAQWKEFGTILPISQVGTDLENIGLDNGYEVMDNGKLLRNGQLVIVRDGVEYNAQGQIIKE